MRFVIVLLISVMVSLSGKAEERLALVIGNSDYDQNAGGYLENPVQDAQTVAAALEEVGFKVTLLNNLNDKAFKRAVLEHRERIERAGPQAISFFYFAGHGANDRESDFGGSNYIIPVGASLRSVRDLSIEAIELGDVIQSFSRAGVSFVIFDACRNFPFSNSSVRSTTRGFTPEASTKGTFIAFSSEPGSVAFDDSGYAKALADTLKTPGMHQHRLFKFSFFGFHQPPESWPQIIGSHALSFMLKNHTNFRIQKL